MNEQYTAVTCFTDRQFSLRTSYSLHLANFGACCISFWAVAGHCLPSSHHHDCSACNCFQHYLLIVRFIAGYTYSPHATLFGALRQWRNCQSSGRRIYVAHTLILIENQTESSWTNYHFISFKFKLFVLLCMDGVDPKLLFTKHLHVVTHKALLTYLLTYLLHGAESFLRS